MATGFRKFDVFPKLDNEYRIGTSAGGILSILSLVAAVLLSYVEIKEYCNPPVRQRLMVDSVRPTLLDGVTITAESQPRLDVFVDVTLPHMPCYLLHLDVIDSFSQMPMPVDKIHSVFTRQTKTGQTVGELPRDFLDSEKTEGCGSCVIGDAAKQCCNSCQEVFAAFRAKGMKPPPMASVAQCKSVVERLKKMEGEGCHVQSRFRAMRLGGEFHLSPGLSWFNDGWHVHDLSTFGKSFPDLNMSHSVNRLQFAESDKLMPLDGFSIKQEKKGAWRVVYTADVLADNYSVSRFNIYNSNRLTPGIIWKYDVSPIKAISYVDKEPFMHLMTRLMTVIGGVLGMFRFLDQMLYLWRKRQDRSQKFDE